MPAPRNSLDPARSERRRRSKITTASPAPSEPTMMDAIFERVDEMERTPRGGIAMCHQQGKTAVYVSEDRKYIVEHPPHGQSGARFATPNHKAVDHSGDAIGTLGRDRGKRGREDHVGTRQPRVCP